MATKKSDSMPTTEQRLNALEARNRRVETNKAWETSFTRRAFISLITYLTASSILYVLLTPDWYFGAIIPVCGYLLSTLSLPYIRQQWEARHGNKKV